MVWPGPGTCHPHLLQGGLELSRQGRIPPERPSLPAKEHRPQPSAGRAPERGRRQVGGSDPAGVAGWVGVACSQEGSWSSGRRGWGSTSGFLEMASLAWVCWSHFSLQLTEAKGTWLPCGQYGQVWVAHEPRVCL